MSPAFRWPLSFGAACYALALWAALFGVHTTYDLWQTEWVWWPGSIAAVACAAGFTLLVPLQLAVDYTLTGSLTALQLLAAGTWAIAWVAVRAPHRPVPDAAGLPSLRGPQRPAAPADGELRHYTWAGADLTGRPQAAFAVPVPVPAERLEEYRRQPHDHPPEAWDRYARPGREVRAAARALRELAQRHGFDRMGEVRLVLAFVTRGLGPAAPLYAAEALADGPQAGRRARTFLAGALLAALGHPAALLVHGGQAALAVAGARGAPGHFIRVQGEPSFYAALGPDESELGELPVAMRDLPWVVLPLGGQPD